MIRLISIIILLSGFISCATNEPILPEPTTSKDNNKVNEWDEIIVDEDSYTIEEKDK